MKKFVPKNKRYTPKISDEALRQSWLTIDPSDPKLNKIGQTLAFAARYGPTKFSQVCRELRPETLSDRDGERR